MTFGADVATVTVVAVGAVVATAVGAVVATAVGALVATAVGALVAVVAPAQFGVEDQQPRLNRGNGFKRQA